MKKPLKFRTLKYLHCRFRENIEQDLFFVTKWWNLHKHQRTPKFPGSVAFPTCEEAVLYLPIKATTPEVSVGQTDLGLRWGRIRKEKEIEETFFGWLRKETEKPWPFLYKRRQKPRRPPQRAHGIQIDLIEIQSRRQPTPPDIH